MQALKFEGKSGFYRPKAGLEALSIAEELKRALLEPRSRQYGDYITIDGGYDGSPEIRCAFRHSSIFRRPFALTEEDAKDKLSAWLERQRLVRYQARDQGTNTVGPPLANGPVQDESSRTTIALSPAAPPVPSGPPFATTEADAVRALRERGYYVFPA